MDLIAIALVCSQLAVPDHRNCMVDNSIRHMKLEIIATNEEMCEFNGMVAAAETMRVNPQFEYVKVLCVRPSLEINRMPG